MIACEPFVYLLVLELYFLFNVGISASPRNYGTRVLLMVGLYCNRTRGRYIKILTWLNKMQQKNLKET